MWNDEPILRDLQLPKGNSQFTGINFSLKREFPSFYSIGLFRIKCVLFVCQLRAKNSQILATRALRSLGLRVILRSIGPTFVRFPKQINLNRVSVSTGCWRNHETVTTNLLFNSHQSNLPFFFFLCVIAGQGDDYLTVSLRDGGAAVGMTLAKGRLDLHIKPVRIRFDDNQWHKIIVLRKVQEVMRFIRFISFPQAREMDWILWELQATNDTTSSREYSDTHFAI